MHLRLRYFMILCICVLTKPIQAQTWAIKATPVVWPTKVLTVFALPAAIEYEQNRVGYQIAPVFIYIRELLNRSQTSPTGIGYRPTEYTNHFHLNFGTRKYLGKKPINRSWMIGVNVWWGHHRTKTNEPIIYSPDFQSEKVRVRTGYTGVGGFIGKNFSLGKHFFIETKIAWERFSAEYKEFYRSNDTPQLRHEFEKFWFARPTLLIGYRW